QIRLERATDLCALVDGDPGPRRRALPIDPDPQDRTGLRADLLQLDQLVAQGLDLPFQLAFHPVLSHRARPVTAACTAARTTYPDKKSGGASPTSPQQPLPPANTGI